MVSSAFFQRKAEDESEIWTLLDTCTMKQCEFKHQNVYPRAMMNLTILFLIAKTRWIPYEHLFDNELFEEYIKHTRKLLTKEFNSHCKQPDRGFWYYH